MNILVIGAGGVGSSIAAIAQRRNFFNRLVLADISLDRAQAVVTALDDGGRFAAARVDAARPPTSSRWPGPRADVIVNACDPRLNPPIFDAAFEAGCPYIDMAMHMSTPHPTDPFQQTGREAGRRPVRHGRAVRGGRACWRWWAWASSPACPTSSPATPPTTCSRDRRDRRPRRRQPRHRRLRVRAHVLDLDHHRGVPEPADRLRERTGAGSPRSRSASRRRSTFPEGIGPVECVNVEHEEVLLMPALARLRPGDVQVRPRRRVHRRAEDAAQARARQHEPVIGCAAVEVSPRDVVAAVLPNPAELGHLMHGRTCAGTWVHGHRHDGQPREVYLYHVVDNEWTMPSTATRPWCGRRRSTPWWRSSCSPAGAWKGAGVLGPGGVRRPMPYLDLLAAYGSHHGMVEMGDGYWPGAVRREAAPVELERPVVRPPRLQPALSGRPGAAQ